MPINDLSVKKIGHDTSCFLSFVSKRRRTNVKKTFVFKRP